MNHRIVYIIDGLGMGGAERLMIDMLKFLSREDFEPRVCVLQEKDHNFVGADLQAQGIPVDRLPVRYLRDLSAIPRLSGYLRTVNADLVHTQLELSNVVGNIAAKLNRLPSVCTIHVLPTVSNRLKRNVHYRLEAFILRSLCDRVIAVSEKARQMHISMNGARPSQVMTIYNGIDITDFSKLDRATERATARMELGIPQNATVLISVAVLRPEKGIDCMLEALPSILDSYSNAYYLIVGEGPRRQEWEARAAELGIHDHVIFTGLRRDVPRLLAASDIFVLPSLTEALPTVLAEAMASRLPIIATSVGGVAEMVEEGASGYVLEPQDVPALTRACNHLLDSPDTRGAMAERGWQIVNQKFSIQAHVENLRQLYLELIDQYGR
jgi:glycosyltransferase involved in cell wall biosynthesis